MRGFKQGNGQIGCVKMAGSGKKRKKNQAVLWKPLAVLALMVVSFAAGMWTHSAISRPLYADAGLTYIEDIPVTTDFIPEGSRA